MTTRETELTAQVAALELEVARLRSVMADVIKAHGYTGGTPIEALSTPIHSYRTQRANREGGEDDD